MRRIDSDFYSKGTRCAGWLYLPEVKDKPPVVIMAHGIAGERTFRLPAFAQRFVRAGLAVFLFDYRNFGDSDGEPRNLVSPRRHLEDWRSAIEYVRGLNTVNPDKIALWGTSFSGGHVLVSAATNQKISAVVCQVPFVDSLAIGADLKFSYIITAIQNALLDLMRMLAKRSPHYIPVVSEPGSFALMNTEDSKSGYLSLIPENSDWKNECPARILLSLPFYRPIKYVHKIGCPVLIVYAEKDSLIPYRAVERTAERIKNVQLVKLPIGHFEIYSGDSFEKAVEIELKFLLQHLS